MNNRFFVALMLSMLLLLTWSALTQPKKKQGEDQKAEKTAEEDEQKPVVETRPTTPESQPSSGPAASMQVAEAAPYGSELVLANDKLRVLFDQKGAVVATVWLLDHWEHVEDKGKPGHENKLRFIRSYEGGPRAFDLIDGNAPEASEDWLNARLWETSGPAADGRSISFHTELLQDGNRYRLTRTFAFHETSAQRLVVKVGLELLASEAGSIDKSFWMNTSGGVFPEERADRTTGFGKALSHVQVGVRDDGSFELVSFPAKDLIGEPGKGIVPNAEVACDMGVYFGAYLAQTAGDSRRKVRARAIDPWGPKGVEEPTREQLEAIGPVRTYTQVEFPLAAKLGEKAECSFDWYVGAKDHRAIKANYAEGERLRSDYLDLADAELTAQSSCCSFGAMNWLVQAISKAVVWLISFFTGIFHSTGVAIIVLTLFVKLLMFPITRKSQVAMHEHSKKMARIKPKIDALKEKYKGDQQKVAAEQMKMMKQEGIGMLPLAGCLPLFLQMPIFFGLFAAIRFDYELRHAAFLWCHDLSMPDTVIAFTPIKLPCAGCLPGGGGAISGLNVFPLLMIAAMFFHQLGMPKSPDPQMQQQQKMMMFMPIFFGVLMYGYAAGLSVYWLSSSLFGIFEQRVIKKLFPIEKDAAPSAK